ncbi:MAG: YibE/F family protein [Clostridia bacterium]|nr:YibE/F family protein [Clostridia bacterium]
MYKKIILIILTFVLMMNLLIGVIYATDDINIQEGESVNETEATQVIETPKNDSKDIKQEVKKSGRQYYILFAIIVFIVSIIIIEKKSCIKNLIRYVLTILILYYIYIKAIINDKNIWILTGIVSFLIVTMNILIKEGIHRKSFSEVISILSTSFICGFIVFIIGSNTNVIGMYKSNLSNNIILGMAVTIFLGIFIDIVPRIISRLDLEKDKAQDIDWKEQFKIGVIVGKEVISEKINVLFLLFAGITLIPMCYYLKNGYKLNDILNIDEIFLIGIIIFIGNIGLIISVPITSFFYAILNRKKTIYKTVSDNKIDGKRSLKL